MRSGPAPRRGRGRFILSLLLLAPLTPFGGSTAGAHDLWLVPGKFRLARGESTRVFVTSGDVFPESLHLVGAHRVVEVTVHGPGWEGERHVVSELRVDGRALTFDLVPPAAGTHVLGLETRARRVRLKPEDFNDYLEEEELEDMAELREAAGEAEAPAVERYAKWAKTVVDVAEGETTGGREDAGARWSEPIGHRIEIVPRRHPNRLGPLDGLPFQVLFEGEPLAGALVVGGRAGGESRALETVTDGEGYGEVSVPSPGRWYLRTIHMVRLDEEPEVQWESFWCTLTFEVSEPEGENR